MNYSVERFKVSDWDEIDIREEAKADFEVSRREAVIKEVYTNGMPFFTLRADGKVIFIYGFMYGGMGTYHPAVMASKDLRKHTRKVIQLCYDYFATYVPSSCRRMEAFCDIMDTTAVNFAKKFGFNIIGIRHNATAEGHDQVILERLTLADPRKIKR
jgi:hypothetical protein